MTQPDLASSRRLTLRVNAQLVYTEVLFPTTLAELLRDTLGLRGTKIACNQAACGACTVIVDGAPVFACHTLRCSARVRLCKRSKAWLTASGFTPCSKRLLTTMRCSAAIAHRAC